jgi:hypothetical protein
LTSDSRLLSNTFEEEKGRGGEQRIQFPETFQKEPTYSKASTRSLTPLVGFFDGNDFLGR